MTDYLVQTTDAAHSLLQGGGLRWPVPELVRLPDPFPTQRAAGICADLQLANAPSIQVSSLSQVAHV